MLNRWVLSRDRKTATEGTEVTRSGRLFQTRVAAAGKARSPTVGSRVRSRIRNTSTRMKTVCFGSCRNVSLTLMYRDDRRREQVPAGQAGAGGGVGD